MSKSTSQPLNLQDRNKALETQIATTKSNLASSLAQLQDILTSNTTNPTTTVQNAASPVQTGPPNSSPDPNVNTLSQAQAIVRQHIDLVHRYNAIKDIGLKLADLIADKDGKRRGEVLEDLGIGEDD